MALKTIAIETIHELAKTNPHGWHRLMQLGKLDPTLRYISITPEDEEKALNEVARMPEQFRELIKARQSVELNNPLPPAPATTIRVQAEYLHAKAICEKCEWNINNVCEHSGCKPCRVRAGGGLIEKLKDNSFHCSAGKWY